MNYKQQLVRDTAIALATYGFKVYLSKNREYGFYTDSKRVVSFGGCWRISLDFHGQYLPSRLSGTGWQIAKDHGVPTLEQAESWIKENAPDWSKNPTPIYTTPKQYLESYGASSSFTEFTPDETLYERT